MSKIVPATMTLLMCFAMGCVSSQRTSTQAPPAKSTSGYANGCSIECPNRTEGGTGGSVTCRDGYVAVCQCNPHPEPMAYCVPETEYDGPS